MLGLGLRWVMPDFKIYPVSGRALGSLTQVEAPPRIMTPGGTLQLPHPYGQPLSVGWNPQKSLPAHAPLMDSFCLLLLIRGQVNADWDRSAAGRHLAARRSLLRAGRGLRGCCGSRAKALRSLPPPPPRPHLSREPPPSFRPPPPPTQHGRLPFPARSRRQPLHWRVAVRGYMPAFVRWRRGAYATATRDPTTAPSSGSTHVEPTGPRWSPRAGLRTGLRVQLSEPLGAPTRLCPSQSFLHARVWQVGKSLRLPSAPPDIPGQSRRASRTGAGRRLPLLVPALAKRLARRAPPGAGLGAVPAPGLPAGCWAGAEGAACAGRVTHPGFLQRRHPAAVALQEGGPAAPVPPHPRAPRVRAPGLQKLPGWRRQDFWAAPPSRATTLRSQRSESPWRLCCSIQDPAPRLPAGLQSTPAGRCPEAAPPARVPHSPFPVEGGIQSLHPGCSATAHGLLERAAGGRS